MKKMNVKQAIKNASKAALKYKDGKPKKEKDLPEVTVSKNIFKGPFAKMKAKKSIKSGAFDTAFAKKRGLGGKEKVIKYSDSGTAVDLSKLTALNMEKPKGTNKPVFMKKTVTSSKERRSEKIRRNTE
jgi:hypothetical protein